MTNEQEFLRASGLPIPTKGFLSLTRKVDEQVIITLPDGRFITVQLGKIKGSKVATIHFNAPRDIDIRRAEVSPRRDDEEEQVESLKRLIREQQVRQSVEHSANAQHNQDE